MALIEIAHRSQVVSGKITRCTYKNIQLVLVLHEGSVKAYQGTCPHEHTELADGHIEDGNIVCPMHQWNFSCADGRNTRNQKNLVHYTVTEKDGKIFVASGELEKDDQTLSTKKTITINDLPSPKGDFIVGHLRQFNVENKHQLVEQWVQECGELFRISLLGKKFIVSADHSLNEAILKNRPYKFRRFSKITEVLDEMGINGVFNAEGDRWIDQRKVTAEALNAKNVKGFFPIIAQKTEVLLNRWKKLEAQQDAIDIQKEMMRFTVDITTVIAFGYETMTLEKDNDVIQDHLEKIFPMINKRMTAPLPTWRYFKSKADKELDIALHETQKIINRCIQLAKQKLDANPALKETPANLLEALLVQQEKLGKFTDRELFGNVFTTLLAGEDTTSNSISWTFYYLALHPEVMKKIQAETDTVFGAEDLATRVERLTQLKWTEAAATEAMRLKPVSPMLFIEAVEDITVNQLEIKKGMCVIMQNKVPQTHEQNFVQADRFMPERWLSKCPFTGAHSPNVIKAFGGGPRFCPGKNLALNEMVMAIAMICHNFDVTLGVNAEAVRERFSFTMFPENLMLRIKKRNIHMVNV
jgi:cytochrome P450/nitrite reductase/ring-hydroxylating ferredoxin subunit